MHVVSRGTRRHSLRSSSAAGALAALLAISSGCGSSSRKVQSETTTVATVQPAQVFPTPSPESDAPIPLEQALKESKVTARARFDGSEVVVLEMKRLVSRPLHVVVPPGVYCDGPGRRKDMLTVEEVTVGLLNGGLSKTYVAACSVVMYQDGIEPDQLSVRVLPPDDPLRRLATAIAADGSGDRVPHQLAVWAVTLNPSRRALSSYRVMPMEEFLANPLSARGKPAATKQALQQARALLAGAGISITGKRMFR